MTSAAFTGDGQAAALKILTKHANQKFSTLARELDTSLWVMTRAPMHVALLDLTPHNELAEKACYTLADGSSVVKGCGSVLISKSSQSQNQLKWSASAPRRHEHAENFRILSSWLI